MPGLIQLKTCCCCCSTETGTKIIGWLQAVCSIIASVLTILAIAILAAAKGHEKDEHPDDSTFTNMTAEVLNITTQDFVYASAGLIYYIFESILGIYLLVGVYKRNMSFIRLWVVICTILFCISVAAFVIRVGLLIAGHDRGELVGMLITLVLSAYFLLVVHSFYREGKTNNTAGNY